MVRPWGKVLIKHGIGTRSIPCLAAGILTLISSLFYKSDKGFLQSFNKLNWTSMALGVAIVGLKLVWGHTEIFTNTICLSARLNYGDFEVKY